MTLAQQYADAFWNQDFDRMNEIIKYCIVLTNYSSIGDWNQFSAIYVDGSVGGCSWNQRDHEKYNTCYED